ncbi:hypothetical protein [Pedobacter rhizosphaerae]|uniref:Uncharacterized protein n=1 Tax=Pedobacter rhizosphaerae TaxID=390241 RepID=A0A1H9LLE7_9SPHI|nr:hypothetical protein [Pedobacter rhizosphaerae]SER12188.1 hypothetical protein SAMN04488023_104198 [Pedobacter rhizosphaerae]
MKTTSAYLSNNQAVNADVLLTTEKLNNLVMKKLANTSPFLLMLLPVFVMFVLFLTVNNTQNDAELVVKPAKTSIVKQVSAVFK